MAVAWPVQRENYFAEVNFLQGYQIAKVMVIARIQMVTINQTLEAVSCLTNRLDLNHQLLLQSHRLHLYHLDSMLMSDEELKTHRFPSDLLASLLRHSFGQ